MERLFAAVLSMSVTGSLVIAAVLIARLLLNKAPKILSYALWLVVLVRLVCPVSFSSPYYGVPPQTADPMVPAVRPGAAVNAAGPALEPVQQAEAAAGASLMELLSLVWAVGAAALLLYSLVSYVRLRKKLVGAVRVQENIYMADYLETPFVLGLVRPRIYLPSTLQAQEVPCILAHEQYHIRRLDHLVKPLGFLALCLHWFNPLVWLAFLLFCKDMEMSCDEAVLKQLGTGARAEYSAALLSLATGRKILAGMPLAFGEGDTKGRIIHIKRWKKPALWVVAAAAAACVLLAAFLLTDKEEALEPQQALDALAGSIRSDEQELWFTVPAGAGSPEDWTILIYGRAEYPDGMTMSRHYLEGTVWEPGKEYHIDLSDTQGAVLEPALDAFYQGAERQIDLTKALPQPPPPPLTEETADSCMRAILDSFTVQEDGAVRFVIPAQVPQSDNERACLNIDLSAEFTQGDRDVTQVLLEQERSWQGGQVYTGQLELALGEPERVFLRVSFPEVYDTGWRDVFPAQYLELTPPFESRDSDANHEETLSAVQEGQQVRMELTFYDAPAVQLRLVLPEGITLGQPLDEADRAGYQLCGTTSEPIGELFLMRLAAEPEDLKTVEPAEPQLPMQIFAGAALPNHVMYEDYLVQNFTATGAAATAVCSSQDLSLMDTGLYDAAVDVPFGNRKNLALFYDYEAMPVFLQIGFDEAAVSQPVCAEIAQSVVVRPQ